MIPGLNGFDRYLYPSSDAPHHPECPQHEDADVEYECGGINEHFCGKIQQEVGCAQIEKPCACPALIEADRAEEIERRGDR